MLYKIVLVSGIHQCKSAWCSFLLWDNILGVSLVLAPHIHTQFHLPPALLCLLQDLALAEKPTKGYNVIFYWGGGWREYSAWYLATEQQLFFKSLLPPIHFICFDLLATQHSMWDLSS